MLKMQGPFYLFEKWLKEACLIEPYGMLSTVKQDLSPSTRVVLFKVMEEENFTFCTNINSSKSREIFLNNKVSICFYWENIAKQVRIEGTATEIPRELAINFFQKRPREHQLASIVSKQSKELLDQQSLLTNFKKLHDRFLDKEIPTPYWWTGFSIEPHLYEFWERGNFRLHHRTIYKKDTLEKKWNTSFLYP